MRIQTFSIVVGGTACNAKCPFCVSKMTPEMGATNEKMPDVNWVNFAKAVRLADKAGQLLQCLLAKVNQHYGPV
jgi:uncharacterized radical SAM superfamily protein